MEGEEPPEEEEEEEEEEEMDARERMKSAITEGFEEQNEAITSVQVCRSIHVCVCVCVCVEEWVAQVCVQMYINFPTCENEMGVETGNGASCL